MTYNKSNNNQSISKSQQAIQALFTLMSINGDSSMSLKDAKVKYSFVIEGIYGDKPYFANTFATVERIFDASLPRKDRQVSQINEFKSNNFIA